MKCFFDLLDVDSFFRKKGACRVSESASEKLAELLQDSAEEVVFKAKIYARHAGRRDINRDDVLLAVSDFV